ncbi:hypothetical protein FA13DRAFT_844451 [Coprinellus micaceus]|uniref:Uncharacterized protein n=1 Tax=Coprinellus micaceus TaxID=71717 RepID=A0A4Y7T1C2_COPMI|nr:hypothetical protein FA13DRAFT_844451 [Coprinellus micaceus]
MTSCDGLTEPGGTSCDGLTEPGGTSSSCTEMGLYKLGLWSCFAIRQPQQRQQPAPSFQPHSLSRPKSPLPTMLFSKSMRLVAFAVTAFASVSFAKPLAQAHGGVALSSRGVHAGGVPQVAKRGLLDPLNLGNTVTGNTVPALLVNLNTNLGSLLTGDLNGTVPSSDGGAVGVTTDIEAIKALIEAAQNLLTNALGALTGVTSGGSPLETVGALTNVIKTVVKIIASVVGLTKGLTTRDLPVVGDLPIIGDLPINGGTVNLPLDNLPIIGGLLSTLTKTLAQLIATILGQIGNVNGIAGKKAASLDVLKALLAPLVAVAASLLKTLGVDPSALTGVVGL